MCCGGGGGGVPVFNMKIGMGKANAWVGIEVTPRQKNENQHRAV